MKKQTPRKKTPGKKEKFSRNPRRHFRISYRMKRVCVHYLLPVALLFCLISYAFPRQTQTFLEGFRQNILEPADDLIEAALGENVLEPIRMEITDLLESVLKPLGLSLPGSTHRDLPQISVKDAPGSGDFEVHFLDVGQGLSVLVKSGEHALLYDGGDRESSSFVVSYLQQQKVKRLDYLIASHYDADHISGLIGVLHAIPVEMVIGPDYVHDSQTYSSFMNAVSAADLEVAHPAVGSEYLLGSSYFTVLSPERITSDSNNNSVAIRLVNGQNSFLLTGDAETDSEEEMCSSGLDLYCDVLCPGHHGSSTSTSALFLAYTQPEFAVISVGAGNDYGHPHRETLQRLADTGVTVYRTDELGTVIARSDGKHITWNVP